MKHLLYLIILLSIAGCRTVQTVPVETIHEVTKHDTLYINDVQYDSIYVQNDKSQEYHLNPLNPLKPSETDTLFVKDVSIEYRYRLLRDTVYRTKIEVQRDSIPYEVKVVETKEVKYTPWYAKTFAWIGVICLVIIVLYVILKFVLKR